MGQLHKVGETSDVPPGSAIAVEIKGQRLALFNIDGKFYAIDATCPHSGGPLSEGDVDETAVTCPWHGASFNLADGSVLSPPADEDVASYRVPVDGSEIMVVIPCAAGHS